MTQHDLLPGNATELERAFSLASDPSSRVDPPVTAMRGIKLIGTPPSWLPFLIFEYGLGELSPYVPSLFQLIAEGVQWQRVRGTPASIAKGLEWIGYSGSIEEEPIRRARWHLFQLELNRVRDHDEPDLARIEGITQLSVPLRSQFWRGFKTYDVRAMEYGWMKWGDAIWSNDSGVRLAAGHAKWSFGRAYELDTTLSQSVIEALGLWTEPVSASRPYTWEDVVWPNVPWVEMSEQERRDTIISGIIPLSAWITFRDAQNNVIGHRRARAWHKVAFAGTGAPYQVGATFFSPTSGAAIGLYIEAMTDFGEGYGHTAAKWEVRLGATLVDAARPGLLWAQPSELTGGTVAAEKTETIEFGRTVRERCRALLRVA